MLEAGLRLNQIRTQRILTLLIVLSTIWFTTQLIAAPADLWDGTVFGYAIEMGNFVGWNQSLDESGWDVDPFLHHLANWAGTLFGYNYFFGHKLIASLSIIILIIEIYILGIRTLFLGRSWALLASLLAITSQVWTALASSMMLWHAVAIACAFVSVRFLQQKGSPLKVIAGAMLLVPSFTMNSNLIFVPTLAFVYFLSQVRRVSKIGGTRPSALPFVFTSVSAITYGSLITLINPKFGRYVGYNSVSSITSLEGMLAALHALF